MMSKQIFTLLQVAGSIRKTLENRYQQTYWVRAELYKMNEFASGHAFPELVQRENGKILANLNGVIWKTHFQRIRMHFEKTVQEPLSEGKELLLEVKIVFSETFGLSLHILDIDATYSLGALHQLKINTLKKLDQEGLLNKNQQLRLYLPKRIALISADSSKGLSDFMEVLNTRKSQFGISTFLFNCTLQGDPAVDSMVNTLEKIQRISHHFDAVAIIRGGGAEVGMSCYDDYRLCRAIAEFPLPVLCGIGHSTNLTVAEMVANHHEITPSMLATSLLRIFEEKLTALNNAKERILAHRDFFMRSVQKTIGIKSLEISRLSRIRVEKEWRVLESLGLKMNKNSRSQTSYHSHSLLQTPKDISRNIRFKLEREGLDILALLRSSINSSKTLSNSACNSLDSLEKTMAILDPKSVLARGYSIARKNNEVVKTSETLHQGDVVEIEFYQGKKATKVI